MVEQGIPTKYNAGSFTVLAEPCRSILYVLMAKHIALSTEMGTDYPLLFKKAIYLPFTFLESLSSSTIASDFLLVAVFFAGMTVNLEDNTLEKTKKNG